MQLPLNDLQRVMRGWAELHPYNAVDVVEVLTTPDASRLQAAARAELESCGVSRFQASSRGKPTRRSSDRNYSPQRPRPRSPRE